MLEYTSYCAGMKFESPLFYELIGSSYICSELNFTQEYGWISNLHVSWEICEKKGL